MSSTSSIRKSPTGSSSSSAARRPSTWPAALQRQASRSWARRPEAIDRAEDRERFGEIVRRLKLNQPDNDNVTNVEGALKAAERIGYPVLVRPSYVLGGRAMEIVYDAATLREYHGARPADLARSPDPHRQVPGRCRRARRGRHQRRDGHRHRRASWSTSRRRASTRATAPACCRRSPSPRISSRPSKSRPACSPASSVSWGS